MTRWALPKVHRHWGLLSARPDFHLGEYFPFLYIWATSFYLADSLRKLFGKVQRVLPYMKQAFRQMPHSTGVDLPNWSTMLQQCCFWWAT